MKEVKQFEKQVLIGTESVFEMFEAVREKCNGNAEDENIAIITAFQHFSVLLRQTIPEEQIIAIVKDTFELNRLEQKNRFN